MILNDEMTRIEVCLRTDPNVIAYLSNSIKTALNIGLSSNKNSVSDLESFHVCEVNTPANPNTVAKFLCESSPNGSTHQMI
jgi:hypothetical protein